MENVREAGTTAPQRGIIMIRHRRGRVDVSGQRCKERMVKIPDADEV